MKNLTIYELTPNNGRTSFYGKARVIVDNNTCDRWLISYNTLLMYVSHGVMYRCASEDVVSNTTSAHIKSFMGINKKQFGKLKYKACTSIKKRFCLE